MSLEGRPRNKIEYAKTLSDDPNPLVLPHITLGQRVAFYALTGQFLHYATDQENENYQLFQIRAERALRKGLEILQSEVPLAFSADASATSTAKLLSAVSNLDKMDTMQQRAFGNICWTWLMVFDSALLPLEAAQVIDACIEARRRVLAVDPKEESQYHVALLNSLGWRATHCFDLDKGIQDYEIYAKWAKANSGDPERAADVRHYQDLLGRCQPNRLLE